MKQPIKKLNGIGEYRTIEGWADVFGVDRSTLEDWVRRQGIEVKKLGGAALLTLDDLGQYRAKIANIRKLLQEQ